MIKDIQNKYDQLTAVQKEIFAGYGLRQIKHFVEIILPQVEAELPTGAVVQGINVQGKVQAVHESTAQNYLWISDLTWQSCANQKSHIDTKADLIAIWKIFQLADYGLIDLSHVHRDFLQSNMT